ncbi:hypothetical protein ACNKHN_08890 [Shigella flexneri]
MRFHCVISKPTLWNTWRSGEENDNNESFPVQGPLPYLALHLNQIADHHYHRHSVEEMQRKRAGMPAIAPNPQTPDFDNTILALEQSENCLPRYQRLFCDDCGAYR